MKNLQAIEFKIKRLLSQGTFWNYKSVLSWNWMEFSEHKEYNFWDPVKDIDWKASAKGNKLYVKKYEEDKDLNILFVFDLFSNFDFWSKNKTKIDILKEVFYSLALVAYYNNDNIWALFFGNNLEFVPYKKQKENIYSLLDKLQNYKNLDLQNRNINNLFEALVKKRIKNNLIFIFSDFVWEIDSKLLKILSLENDIVYINIFDDFELDLSFWKKLDLWNLSFNFWKEFLNIDLKDSIKKEEYKKVLWKKLELFKLNLRQNRIWYLNINTSDDVFKKLVKYFNK